jgi:putative hydrolase of the HAD superfamily
VLFDGLGTLISLDPPGPALAEHLRREHGVEITLEEAEHAFAAEMSYYREHHHEAHDKRTLTALRVRCAQALRGALPARLALALGPDELVATMLGSLNFSAYPDAHDTLPRLRARGLRLVVVSNWDCDLPAVLRGVGLGEQLDGAVSSGEVGRPKPAPGIFQTALAAAEVSAAQALHVGDSVKNDVLGALDAGIAPVLLRRAPRMQPSSPQMGGAFAREPARVPVISSLGQLPAVISQRGG